MTIFVDDVAIPFGRMKMCHMWSGVTLVCGDAEAYTFDRDELLAMADTIGVARKWLQQPPKASWLHFDICVTKKALAIKAGAILTDRFGAAHHTALLTGNQKILGMIQNCRTRRAA